MLDLAVLSLYCQRCAIAMSQWRGNCAKFNRWLDSHTECNQNYRSTSGGTEVEAEILWNRSMERGCWYTTTVSDGDSKSFKHLTNLCVYGDVELHKEECVNHVAKRLGTALHKLARRRTGFRPADRKHHGQVGRVLLLGSSWQHWQAEQDARCSVGLILPRLVHRREAPATAVRWELTAGASTRRHSPPGRSQDLTASTSTRRCRLKSPRT